MSSVPVLQVLALGAGASIQDLGRTGWKRFGIPPGGAMDADSARQANLLVGNEEGAPVIELLFTGARFRVLSAAELAITGADVESECPQWRNFHAETGQRISFERLRAGVWTYLAVQGGFAGPRWFGSASVDPRAGLGGMIQAGAQLHREKVQRVGGISSRFVPGLVRERFDDIPTLRVWSGPEWQYFPESVRALFLSESWLVSMQSDRAGYRLEGAALESGRSQMPSAPVAVGTVQVPPNGLPIVLLRDGPTVGGYPRLAILDPSAISRFTQCAPGTCVQFELVE
ncbi:MAG TPA: biotin-dependent carboxyltransferase family protein [Terrimicrobiaceae bacterium]